MAKKRLKGLKFDLAPQDKQKLAEPIQELFISKVLGIEGALITDKSKISDFFLYPKDRATRPGREPNTMVFNFKKYVGPHVNPTVDGKRWSEEHKKKENWIDKEIEAEPDPSIGDIVQKTKEIFGVDISEVCRKPLVDILLYSAENYQQRSH